MSPDKPERLSDDRLSDLQAETWHEYPPYGHMRIHRDELFALLTEVQEARQRIPELEARIESAARVFGIYRTHVAEVVDIAQRNVPTRVD
jgi:NADH:ubiquinone oxidoreductase subunit E